jgi:hypothetical protein
LRWFRRHKRHAGIAEMLNNWNLLSEDLQLILSREAMRRAMQAVATQAESLAEEMEEGTLADRGGVDALRLLAAVMRVTGDDGQGPTGRA